MKKKFNIYYVRSFTIIHLNRKKSIKILFSYINPFGQSQMALLMTSLSGRMTGSTVWPSLIHTHIGTQSLQDPSHILTLNSKSQS